MLHSPAGFPAESAQQVPIFVKATDCAYKVFIAVLHDEAVYAILNDLDDAAVLGKADRDEPASHSFNQGDGEPFIVGEKNKDIRLSQDVVDSIWRDRPFEPNTMFSAILMEDLMQRLFFGA